MNEKYFFHIGAFNFSLQITQHGIRSLRIAGKRHHAGKSLPPVVIRFKKTLGYYLSGKRVDFSNFYLDLSGATDFQKKVWQKIREIGYGGVKTYKWVARRLGDKRRARAVGQALKRNRVLILIPCHRVIASDGTLGGFSAGLKLKKELLDIESHLIKKG